MMHSPTRQPSRRALVASLTLATTLRVLCFAVGIVLAALCVRLIIRPDGAGLFPILVFAWASVTAFYFSVRRFRSGTANH